MKIHMRLARSGAFSGFFNGSLCGRLNKASVDGMNITSKLAEVRVSSRRVRGLLLVFPLRERVMGSDTVSTDRGLYGKYKVERNDGSGEVGGKHHDCRYFVLDLVHDKHAAAALVAYADSCAGEHPSLAADLRALDVGNVCFECGGDGREPDPPCGCREAGCPHARMFPGPCPSCKGWGVVRRKS